MSYVLYFIAVVVGPVSINGSDAAPYVVVT